MRAFIAIQCPDNLKEQIVKVQDKLKDLGKLKLVEPENLHFTLKFLGNVDEKKIDEIVKILDAVSKINSFEVSLKGIGAFPKINYARVVWIGVDKGIKEMEELHRRIDQELEPLGFRKEKSFSSHLTIARVKEIMNKGKFIKILEENSKNEFGNFNVNGIELMKSELMRTGPLYSLIHRFNLK